MKVVNELPDRVVYDGKEYKVEYTQVLWWEKDIPEGGILIRKKHENRFFLVDEVCVQTATSVRYKGEPVLVHVNLNDYEPVTEEFLEAHCQKSPLKEAKESPQEEKDLSLADIVPFCISIEAIPTDKYCDLMAKIELAGGHISDDITDGYWAYYGVDTEYETASYDYVSYYSEQFREEEVKVYSSLEELYEQLDRV